MKKSKGFLFVALAFIGEKKTFFSWFVETCAGAFFSCAVGSSGVTLPTVPLGGRPCDYLQRYAGGEKEKTKFTALLLFSPFLLSGPFSSAARKILFEDTKQKGTE